MTQATAETLLTGDSQWTTQEPAARGGGGIWRPGLQELLKQYFKNIETISMDLICESHRGYYRVFLSLNKFAMP